ncbi:AMP-binding protein [Rhizobium sp. L1K21]|uniref:AMP-binding protein n=1 Tax=Rhizobium sp. L1K21 TaxID=2954933 RepID=UPI002093790C|nr:AMP-binding protein [Rhizobium sp. L1K21]MCO6188261.1 AMP-binding protein [Rhizobium sp. L1K21]
MAFITDMAARRAELTPHESAFIDVETGSEFTFAEVNARAEGMALGLSEMGLIPGDRVAIICHNRAEFFITLFACQKGGFVLTPLNWRQPAPELAPLLTLTEPKCIIHDANFEKTARTLGEQFALPLLSLEKGGALDGFGRAETKLRRRIDDQAIWYLLFTSGTTGQPKAVIQTAAMAWVNAVNIGQAVDIVSADAGVNYLPLFHTAGVNLYTLPLFLAGATSYILRQFDTDAIFRLIAEEKINQFFGVPAIYQSFSQHADIDRVDLGRMKSLGCGGAPLPAPLVAFFAARGALVQNGMGMTETGPTVFLQSRDEVRAHIGSVGKAQILSEVSIAGGGSSGELLIRGPGVTPGYFKNPEATAAAFTEDGWLKTGDVARVGADGEYYIIDRIKDMYISGGENVYPAEVEKLLYTHPQILDVAVIGVPDAKWGETGAAFIQVRKGEAIDISGLSCWCRERIAAYKVPAHFHLVDEFPRTPSGKVKKHELGARLDG